jgi:hypothetical protein
MAGIGGEFCRQGGLIVADNELPNVGDPIMKYCVTLGLTRGPAYSFGWGHGQILL